MDWLGQARASTCTCSNWSQWIQCLPDPPTTNTPVTTPPVLTQGECIIPEIGAVAADVVFLIDESGSVGPTNFRKELNLAECFVNKTVVGPTMVQIGLVTFSWYANNKFFLGEHRDRTSLRNALRDIEYDGGSSYTGKGLRYARLESFLRMHGMRESAQHVLVVLEDGKSENGSATMNEAEELRRLGVTVFAIGIGNDVDRNELTAIASDSSKIFTVATFDLLTTVCDALVQAISKVDGHWTAWGSWTTCSETCGLGSRTRKRTCTDPCPGNGGSMCVGEDTINQACTMGVCGVTRIDGNWANWGFWSPCPVTCGCGSQFRERTCSNPSPFNGGQTCFGNAKETQDCGCAPCPRDGEWTEWGGWETCSKTCGGGTQSRSRTCTNPSPVNGGQECIGDSRDIRECFSGPCPIDGAFTTWGLWSACDLTCGVGERHRERFCSNPAPQNGGKNCLGTNTNTENCNIQPCPINGAWGGWTNWGQCSVTCANGIHTRQRSCDSPSPAFGGQVCPGESSQTQVCTETECPIDGSWSEWGCWSLCSRTCGIGERSRERNCSNPCPAFGGRDCFGPSINTEFCNTEPCATVPGTTTTTTTTPPPPIHGGWSVWDQWSACDATCGDGGLIMRTRRCNNPTPDRGGSYCIGSEFETSMCLLPTCPIDGGFSEWTQWSDCSADCGTGNRGRNRACNSPSPSNGGLTCSGITTEFMACNTERCPIDGGWSFWTSWSLCTESCDGGLQQRTRTCTSPFPVNGGRQCDGSGFESQVCALNSCPVDGNWGAWSDWDSCGVTCGGSLQFRRRACDNPPQIGGGQNCFGNFQESRECATQPCPVNGNWAQWNAWSDCTESCNSGLRVRLRDCSNPAPLSGGLYCIGFAIETEQCNIQPCPTDGQWGFWGPWNSCSKTCDTGTQFRVRSCNNPAPIQNGQFCEGIGAEERSCGTQNCPVDGNWSAWSSWDTCTVTCGGGIYSRVRTCTNPAPSNNGLYCNGPDFESSNCNKALCIINGNWGEWSEWESCSVTCGLGVQLRLRQCNNPFPMNGGIDCQGNTVDSQTCTNTECPVHGGWSPWDSWSGCTTSCGGGITIRSRGCANPTPQNGGKYCDGDYFESAVCNDVLCPVDGALGEWGFWSGCSRPCGGGTRSRNRFCDSPPPSNAGRPCTGITEEVQECNLDLCPIDGNWNQWQYWSPCNKDCGSDATRYRDRACTAPAPLNGGSGCIGTARETEACPDIPCPIDGAWGQWSAYTPCPSTCGNNGFRVSTRQCDAPAQAYGGRYCEGDSRQYLTCSLPECPVDGSPGNWGPWTSCSTSCDIGTRLRIRYCNNPAPNNFGTPCRQEDLSMSEQCNQGICTTTSTTTTTTAAPKVPPVDGNWGGWSQWTTCGRSCGGGFRTRVRRCSDPPPNSSGKFCEGLNYEEEVCKDQPCPVDGSWGSWGLFSVCSTTCGGGTHTRNRGCNNPAPANGGFGCGGNAEETQSCNTVPCPIDGNWESWFAWSTCTKTCNTGSQFRYRTCDNPSPMYGGVNCNGDEKEVINCATNQCAIHGGWSSWGAYGACSVTCGRGQYSRQRFCNNPTPLFGGDKCIGVNSETTTCVQSPCPVNGFWGGWGEWSQCTSTCDGGRQFRQRYCNNPIFAYGGSACPGDHTEFRDCSSNACPVNGAWGQWNGWSSCSVTCAGGLQSRQRSCNNPAPSLQGDSCTGSSSETQSCNLQACPTNGAWSSWIDIGCTRTCGSGTLRRVRTCSNPAPVNNGLTCPGDNEETNPCNTQDCPVNGGFGLWGQWSACSTTCGRGIQKRERVCDSPSPLNGGLFCTGDHLETQECVNPVCSVDGQFGVWSSWNECSRTCGKGVQFRYRTCTSPAPQGNGKRCAGDYWEVQDCSEIPCPTEPPPTTTPGLYICPECSVLNADIVFLIENNCDSYIFNKELEFIRTIVKTFTLRTDAVQISMVSYTALQPKEHFDLKAYHDMGQMLNAIDNLQLQTQCGIRDTDIALRYVRTNSFTQQKGGRSNSVKLIIFVTNGISTNSIKTTQEATDLRQQNIRIIAIGVGIFTFSELRSIAYNNAHLFTSTSAELLYTVRGDVMDTLCSVDGQWSTWADYGPCSTSCGDGYHYRTRLCNNPPSACTGKTCPGDNFQVGYCFEGDCPTTTTTTPTTVSIVTIPPETCEGGTYFRRRNCRNPVLGAADCIGKELCYYSSSTQCISVPPTTPVPVVIDPPELDNIPGCGSVPADIVFLIDKSTSVGPFKFRKMLRFVSSFAQSVSVGPDGVQISVVTFNSYAQNEFNLNTHSNKASLLSAIDAIPYVSGFTLTHYGLKYVRTESFKASVGMRENVAHILVVLTEGASYSKEETMKESAELRHVNIRTIAVGVGAECDRAELEYMGDSMIEVDDVDELIEAEHKVKQVVCEASNVWTLVMSVSRGQSVYPASGVYDLWDGSYTMNENDEMARSLRVGSKPFKSSIVEMWDNFNFTAVRVSFFSNGMEKAFITFDAKDKTKHNWFDCSRIIKSTFTNLKNIGGQRYCGIAGDETLQRRFFIHGTYTGCSSDMGWMAVVEGNTCAWERRTDKPYFAYSNSKTNDKQNSGDYAIADVFAIFVDIDYCSSQPCQNGGVCEELPGNGYHCKCPTNFFGRNCKHQCEPGTYGPMCRKTCSKGCVDNKCIRLTGVCADGCKPGYSGDYCEQECPTGKHGVGCQETCSIQCLNSECNAMDGKCTLGCIKGYGGDFCDEGCAKGTYGDNCNQRCNTGCKDNDCDSLTGKCKAGCDLGFWGDFCDEVCAKGKYGDNCKETCSSGCELNDCDSHTGMCKAGCKVGLYGDFCDEVCAKGTFGDNCRQRCSSGCKDTDCDSLTGICKAGCNIGLRGDFCDADCLRGFYGDACKQTCSIGCNGNDCYPTTGDCKLGCKSGYTGDKCDIEKTSTSSSSTTTKATPSTTVPTTTEETKPAPTQRQGGNAAEQDDLSRQDIIIISVVSAVVFILIIIVICVIARRKPHRREPTPSPSTNASIKGHDNSTYTDPDTPRGSFKEVEELHL